MQTLYNLVIIASIGSAAGFFCFVLYRLAQHIENLSPRRIVRTPPQRPIGEWGDMGAEVAAQQKARQQRKCNNCEAIYTGSMCSECGTVPAPEVTRRRFQGFGSIKKTIEQAAIEEAG